MSTKTVYYKPIAPKPAMLMIIENGKSMRTIELNGDMNFGRYVAPEFTSGIRVSSLIVGRNHGDFIYSDGEYYYRDNNSRNKTFYNDTVMEPINERGSKAVKLHDGDILRIDKSDYLTVGESHPEAVEMIFSTTFSPDEKWNTYRIGDKRCITIGRDRSCDIVLDDFSVSRCHAKIQKKNNGYEIIDNSSVNGIAVNKQPIHKRKKLYRLDVIRISDTIIIFMGDYIVYNNGRIKSNTPFNYSDRSVIMSVNINNVTVGNAIRSKTLLKDIHLDIESGDFILILGGSGAGKTTFIRSLLGEIKADGEIIFDGMDLYKNFKMLKHKIGLVPQFSTTRENDTVRNTIMDAAKVKLLGEYSRQEIKARYDDVIQKMMLTNRQKNYIKELSGGQKKRVEVAIQAISNSEMFILDEPDSGMDYASRVDLMSTLKSCTDSGGVVAVISHSPDDAMEMFTKVIVLAKSKHDEVGHLAYYGDVDNALDFFGVQKLSQIVMEINYEGGNGRADEFIDKFERTRGGNI